jgi:3-oxoacyl-[acyl-carrier protein] reductase
MTAADLDGLSALVTGGASGIGLAIATELAARGARVVVLDRPNERPADLTTELGFVTGDISDADSVRRAVHAAADQLGGLDVLVNNAGIGSQGRVQDHTDEDWRHVLDVNLTGTWNLIRAVLPGMLERGSGRIVTISSEIGLAGLEGYAAYAASKGGVIALTKALARELAPHGIRVNSVAPGPIEAGILLRQGAYSDEWLAAHVPLGRFGRPDEVAACVALLAGDEGGYFVGQVLSPNGGTVI